MRLITTIRPRITELPLSQDIDRQRQCYRLNLRHDSTSDKTPRQCLGTDTSPTQPARGCGEMGPFGKCTPDGNEWHMLKQVALILIQNYVVIKIVQVAIAIPSSSLWLPSSLLFILKTSGITAPISIIYLTT